MRDFINEFLISYHNWRMCNSRSNVTAKLHMNMMLIRLKMRSAKQIKRMEVKRGL